MLEYFDAELAFQVLRFQSQTPYRLWVALEYVVGVEVVSCERWPVPNETTMEGRVPATWADASTSGVVMGCPVCVLKIGVLAVPTPHPVAVLAVRSKRHTLP